MAGPAADKRREHGTALGGELAGDHAVEGGQWRFMDDEQNGHEVLAGN
jgi:hypothetical protein